MKRKDEISDIQGSFTLHNGVKMPYLGLGTYQAENNQEVIDSVKYALKIGYGILIRHRFITMKRELGKV